MLNSALCPLCKDGIGHAMDEAHAAQVKDLIAAAKVEAYEDAAKMANEESVRLRQAAQKLHEDELHGKAWELEAGAERLEGLAVAIRVRAKAIQ